MLRRQRVLRNGPRRIDYYYAIVGCETTAAVTACVKDREYKVWKDIQNELDNVEYGVWVYDSGDGSYIKNDL